MAIDDEKTNGPNKDPGHGGPTLDRLQVIQDIGLALGSTLDQDRLLELIMERVIRILDAERSTLYLHDEEKGEIWSKITQGGEVAEIRLKIPEGLAGWVAETGKTLNVPDAYQDSRFNPDVDKKSGYYTRSILTMPMLNRQGKLVGVVQVLNKRTGPFTEQDEDLLQAIMNQAVISLDNARLYTSLLEQNVRLMETQEKLEQKMRELDLLYLLEQELARFDVLEELLQSLILHATEHLDAEAGAILLPDVPSPALHFRAAGEDGRYVRLELKGDKSFSLWVFQHGQPLMIQDAETDPRNDPSISSKTGVQPRSVLCVPLTGEDDVLGAMKVCNRREGDFDHEDLKLLTLIAGKAAQAIQVQQGRKERSQQSQLAAIGQMLSNVLHDLKAPMTIISGYAQMMVTASDEDQRNKYAEYVLEQFDVMNAMIREVVAYARGETELLVRKVHLHSYLDEIRNHLQQVFSGKNIELDIQLDFRGSAYLDPVKFRRVVYNLARNAAQAMPGGGRFGVSVSRDDGRIVFSFTDTGRGVPPEMEGRLFEPFATSRAAQGGSGLGLPIVKKIVEDHKGDIAYATEPEKGTRFTIRIPAEGPSTDPELRKRSGP